MNQYAPCPQCGNQASELMKFSWWGGVIGPRILTHVKCPSCNKKYNGKTGKDNTTNIVIYTVVVLFASFILVFAVFFGFGILSHI